VLRCAAAGKHVLCEKPTALSAEELREMLAALAAKGLCWLDATWFMHHERLGAIRAERDAGLFGPLGFCHASSSATFCGDANFFETNIRVDPKLDALGCLGDIGWYCVRVALFAFDWEPPQWASAVLHVSKNGVPVDLSGTLTWRARPASDVDSLPLVRTSNFHCSFLRAGQSAVMLQGRSESLAMDDFISPRSADNAKWTVLSADGAPTVHETGKHCDECANMWACFRDSILAVRNGQHPAPFWSDISMLTQLVIDALLQSSRLGGAKVEVAKLA
jgi:predicted dehydrogenase